MKDSVNIQAELKKMGVTQSSIAEMLRVKPASVHNVITGKRSTARIRKAIALTIGKSVEEVFPENPETKEAA